MHVGTCLWVSACEYLCTCSHVHVQALVGMVPSAASVFVEYMSMLTRSVIFYVIFLLLKKNSFFH